MLNKKNRAFSLIEVIAYISLFGILALAMFTFVTRAYFNLSQKSQEITNSQEIEGVSTYLKKHIDFDNMLEDPVITESSLEFKTLGTEENNNKTFIKEQKIYYDEKTKSILHKRKRDEKGKNGGTNVVSQNISDFKIQEKDAYIIIKFTKENRDKKNEKEIQISK